VNHKKITLDTERKSFESIIAMQGDNKSRYIDATIVNRSIPVDLTGCAVKFSAIKPDITDIFNDAVIIDAKGGKVQIELTNQTLAKEGVIQATLVILKEDMQLSVLPFFITVIENPYNPNAIESKPEYQALNNALIVADGYAKELQDASVNLEEKYTTRLNNFGSQLDTKAEQSEVNKRLSFRNFEPIFGYNCYWGEIWGTDGTHTQKNRIEIGNDIKQCEELGIDEITVDIHIGYNSNTSALYIATNMDDVLWAITTFSDLNVKIKNAKIHVGILEDYLKNTITLPVFLSKYKNIVSEICDKLKNTTIENITVLNECSFIDTDTTYTTDVIELLNIAKNKGYKVGITCAGIEHNFNLPTTVIELSDLLCVNCYPTISFKKEKTTYEDSINAWKQHEVNMWIETRKKQYPNKKIIISETGVTNCWEALLSPASNVIDGTISNKATEVYLKGLFEVLNKEDLDCVWWWFGIFTEGTNIQKMFDYELRGIINE
jgi:hypothetical protein